MKRLANLIKVTLLLGALAILASSAFPGVTGATEVAGENCAGSGHSCHFVADGVLHHGKAQEAN